MNSSDVIVVGMASHTVVLGDIQMDVPPNTAITIPGDLASVSKDLARAISQKLLFQASTGQVAGSRSAVFAELEQLRVNNLQLKEANRLLVEENVKLKVELQKACTTPVSDPKLEEILTLLRSNPGGVVNTPLSTLPKVTTSEVVGGEVPFFIPSRISPEKVEGRINIEGEAVASTGVSESRDALRKFRGEQ